MSKLITNTITYKRVDSLTKMSDKDTKEVKIDIGIKEISRDEVASEVEMDVKVMCVDLNRVSKAGQFLILTAGIFFFYLIYGYFQVIVYLIVMVHFFYIK